MIERWIDMDLKNVKDISNNKIKKVMIVDDEDDLREMMSIMVQKEGFQTDIARDGEEFLNKIDEFEPDLVTLDVMMPGLTTPEIFKKLKEKNHKPKIIMLTAVRYSEEEKQLIFNSANVVDYFIKPIDIEPFIDSLKKNI